MKNFFNIIKVIKRGLPGSVFCNRKTTTGFTLVETLVAISVLMISVTGPLYYASESLKAATYAKEQITAFYLAQDAFEQIIKIRDDAVYHGIYRGGSSSFWYSSLGGCETTPCRVNPAGSFLGIDAGGVEESYRLYLDADNVYSHKSDGVKTIYLRKVLIEATDGAGEPVLGEGATEIKVTVRIEWTSRGTQRNFEAYEFLRALNT